MSWLKIDDGLFLHPKWLRTPATARALWITALSYCGKMNTDGRVDSALLPLLGGTVEDADALVSSGLWDATEGGYRFHDFEDYNRTAEQTEALSETRAEAGRAGAAVRWGKATQGTAKQRHSTSIAKNGKAVAKNAPEPEPLAIDKSIASSPLPPEAKPAGSVYDPAKALPVMVEGFIKSKPNPEDWERELRLELSLAAIHGEPTAYMTVILKRWEREGLPQRGNPGAFGRGSTPASRVDAVTQLQAQRLASQLADLGCTTITTPAHRDPLRSIQ